MSIDFLLSSATGTAASGNRQPPAAARGGSGGFAALLEQAAARDDRAALQPGLRQAAASPSVSPQAAAQEPGGETPGVQQAFADQPAAAPLHGMPALLTLAAGPAALDATAPPSADGDPDVEPALDAELAVGAGPALALVADHDAPAAGDNDAAGEELPLLAGLAGIPAEQQSDAAPDHPLADASERDAGASAEPEAGAAIAIAASPPTASGLPQGGAASPASAPTAATASLDGAATAPPVPQNDSATAIRSSAETAAALDGAAGNQPGDGVDPTMAARPAGPAPQPSAATSSPAPSTSSPAGAANLALAAPIASPQWQQDLGRQVAGLSRFGEQRVSLQLNPAELGPLLVELKVVEHHAQVQLFSASSLVRNAVEQAIPQLREALAEQGITLGEATVGEQRDGQQQTAGDNRRDSGPAGGEDPQETAAAPVATTGVVDGRVNLYV